MEYIRSAFLVQESEVPISNGNKKETLRIDQIEDVSSTYKDADVLVFNTGHWWTHERTSEGYILLLLLDLKIPFTNLTNYVVD